MKIPLLWLCSDIHSRQDLWHTPIIDAHLCMQPWSGHLLYRFDFRYTLGRGKQTGGSEYVSLNSGTHWYLWNRFNPPCCSTGLAHAKTAKVHFLAVIPTVPFYASLGLAYSTEFPDRSGLQAKASEKLEEIIKQFNIPAGRSQTHVVYGPPKDQILKLAEAVDAELIVIASHKPGFSTYLLGSTAAAVVRHAKCPVLVVRW